jgi:predicted extracellular nuclease
MFVSKSMKNLMGGILGLLVLLAGNAQAKINDLFISEYVQGSGYNKAIELYNGNSHTVDLSQYQLEFHLNGAKSANFKLPLSGYLTANTTFVVANSLASSEILIVTDMTRNGIWFDADDVITLTYKGEVIDSVGQIGDAKEPNGSQSHKVMRRSAGAAEADTNIRDEINNSKQWNIVDENSFGGLGSFINQRFSACRTSDMIKFYC